MCLNAIPGQELPTIRCPQSISVVLPDFHKQYQKFLVSTDQLKFLSDSKPLMKPSSSNPAFAFTLTVHKDHLPKPNKVLSPDPDPWACKAHSSLPTVEAITDPATPGISLGPSQSPHMSSLTQVHPPT